MCGFNPFTSRLCSQVWLQSLRESPLLSLSEALKSEADFFKYHPAYRNMANRCGCNSLTIRLCSLSTTRYPEKQIPVRSPEVRSGLLQTSRSIPKHGQQVWVQFSHDSPLLSIHKRFNPLTVASAIHSQRGQSPHESPCCSRGFNSLTSRRAVLLSTCKGFNPLTTRRATPKGAILS
jgi:hypothetical protein